MFRFFKPITDVQKDRLLTLVDWLAFLAIAAAFLLGGFYLIFY